MPPCRGARSVFLTFDDGPTPYTPFLIELLAEYGLQATFFWTWSRYSDKVIPSLLPHLWVHHHKVALHGLVHLSAWREAVRVSDLRRAIHLWKKAGVPLVPAYRPPYGHLWPLFLSRYLHLVFWDLMPPDYLPTKGWERELLGRLRPGDVVVLHEHAHNRKRWRSLFSAFVSEGWQSAALPLAVLE
ncbi:MAG: polysaccharide deacetylase family protein [Bacteroidia bacterium]|nr:polysaccharide deacetylase family protein [Bacteroidia bacterium]